MPAREVEGEREREGPGTAAATADVAAKPRAMDSRCDGETDRRDGPERRTGETDRRDGPVISHCHVRGARRAGPSR
jgi:hypothetical protein